MADCQWTQILNTLLVDKNQGNTGAAQASNNLIRCTLAAIGISAIQRVLRAVGIGWTFTLLGGLFGLATALFAVDYRWGAGWRQQALLEAKMDGQRMPLLV